MSRIQHLRYIDVLHNSELLGKIVRNNDEFKYFTRIDDISSKQRESTGTKINESKTGTVKINLPFHILASF